ncbi:unnamed protein product, partial [marine sediment metagenome]
MSDIALPEQIQGPKRREILSRFARQMEQWGLAIPP